MSLRGFFRGDFPFLNVHVVARAVGLDESIAFLIDTGASRTTILDGDSLRLRLRERLVGEPSHHLIGIGGSIRAFALPDARLVMRAAEREVDMALPLLVAHHEGMDRLGVERRRVILRLPSILGRDFLARFDLHLSMANRSIVLDRSPRA